MKRQNRSLIDKAFALGKKSHKNQKRLSGEQYFQHCIAVADIIKNEWGIINENILCAAYLHDVIEDGNISKEEIEKKFSFEIAELVEGVTKLKSDKETIKKLLSVSFLNPGVAIIKLADRLHNIRTLSFMAKKKQIVKAQETLDIYSRLAESLGIWSVKIELEDITFSYLNPSEFEKISLQINSDARLKENFLSYVQSRLKQIFDEAKINVSIEIRVNGLYSLKQKRDRWAISGQCLPDDFNRINDIISFRILTENINDTYLCLKEIHQHFGEIVDYQKYDEFIGANVPVNAYSAIQTTLEFPEGPVEIAITTTKLEEFNNWGVVSLMRQNHPNLNDYIFKLIFTPTNGIRFLPKNGTGIDFAYQINHQLGAEMISVLIDGVVCPPSAVLPNSSTVEVLVGPPRRAPDPDFLNYCLPSTRKIIENQLTKAKRDILIEKGTHIAETILAPRGLLSISDISTQIYPLLYRLGCEGQNDLLSKIGGGFISTDLFNQELDIAQITKEIQKVTTIRIKGADQPGILYDLVKLINKFNKNIINISLKNENDIFLLRILVKGLNQKEESTIRNYLDLDSRFDDWIVV